MKIAHVTSVHSRYDTRIFRKECRSLAAMGHDVTLIVADGRGDECRDGISILDVGKSSNRLIRMFATVNRVSSVATALKADLYHLHDPELLRIALKLGSVGHCAAKVIFDAHESYADEMRIKQYLPAPLRRIVVLAYGWFERHVVRNINGVIVVADSQITGFRKYVKRWAVVPNFVDLSLFPERTVDFDHARILHAGSLSEVRGLGEMIKLAHGLGKRGEIALAGPLDRSASEVGFGNARYLGVLDESALVAEYMRSNIGLILYRPIGQYGMATAVKVYEYMAASMPVIVPDHGDWPELIKRTECGLTVNVNDVDQQVEAVEFLLSNPEIARAMGRNGRKYACAHASWEEAFKAMTALYEDVFSEKNV